MPGFRRALRVELSSLGPAYGFTLTVWSTGALLIHYRGAPEPWEVVVFAGAILLSMGLTAMVAFGRPLAPWKQAEPARYALGVIHVLSVLGGLMVAWGLASWIDHPVAWAIVPFASVLAFQSVVGMEIAASTTQEDPADPLEAVHGHGGR